MKIKILTIFIIFFICIANTLAYENKILFKVNNKIITSVDILNEVNYLNSLNENLKNLEKEKIFQIAKGSLIREKIKEITLLKIFEEIKLDEEDFNRSILNNYSNLNISNIEELNQYLKKFNLEVYKIKKKLLLLLSGIKLYMIDFHKMLKLM